MCNALHFQAITCAAAQATMFATGGEDLSVVLTDLDGSTIAKFSTKSVPRSLLFSANAGQLAVNDGSVITLANVRLLSNGQTSGATLQLAFDADLHVSHQFWCALALRGCVVCDPDKGDL